jgi:hypothetical protein
MCHRALLDQLLEPGAGQRADLRRKKTVQPLADIRRPGLYLVSRQGREG